ncbi:cytochrome c oxidase, cbb3-type subunit II [Sulfuriferula plumbiphila]|uniref:Cytochrome c oxidase, cbb3-type subunit II n=1 Tax=Sulfuriferula plumbiphila TaxID=171865 RepID=A0A512L706_9PROT|nr:cytochrome-c oxidase, cbb3-type subunit II [Sulfuriferula plumbiphila]BBP02868.1 cytochrome c oxidase, cbb3-type subunit II [Sulfuriferula plumbiphila]GEP30265.1 cytochrome c oxidase, cbb3-type subunit II [Sulfuriferula plumbiphila]
MFNFKHEWIETNIGLLLVLTMLAISIGGLVEIAPLFFIKDTVEKVAGVRPYTPLELRGRDIYQREGCYLCHSQMIRPFRDEALRYGHYSLAAESQYDHPFQWGSKRTGPDLARVGKKYSNEWHVAHLISPRSMVPESVMPNFPWLERNELNISDISERMEALRKVGVPYSLTKSEYQANVKQFGAATAEMLSIPDARKNLIAQAESGNYDGDRSKITEMDALVAYLQVLGTMVDFSKYDDDAFVKYR